MLTQLTGGVPVRKGIKQYLQKVVSYLSQTASFLEVEEVVQVSTEYGALELMVSLLVMVVLELAAAAGTLPCAVHGGGPGASVELRIALEDAHHLDTLHERVAAEFGEAVTHDRDHGTVTVVGHGLGEDPLILRGILTTARRVTNADVDLQLGPLSATVLVPCDAVSETVKQLHLALLEDTA